GINWRGGASHEHARALGGALGACRYRLLRLFYVFPVFRRARTFARRQGERNIIGLPLRRLGDSNERAYRDCLARALVRRAHVDSARLAHDRRGEASLGRAHFFSRRRSVGLLSRTSYGRKMAL